MWIYAAPLRATDLGDLPRTYPDVGSSETFRDEVIDYPLRLSEAGVVVDFHLWGGGSHNFDVIAPVAAVSLLVDEQLLEDFGIYER